MKPHLEYDATAGANIGRDPRKMSVENLEAAGKPRISRGDAIREKCLDCCAGSPAEVRRCGTAGGCEGAMSERQPGDQCADAEKFGHARVCDEREQWHPSVRLEMVGDNPVRRAISDADFRQMVGATFAALEQQRLEVIRLRGWLSYVESNLGDPREAAAAALRGDPLPEGFVP